MNNNYGNYPPTSMTPPIAPKKSQKNIALIVGILAAVIVVAALSAVLIASLINSLNPIASVEKAVAKTSSQLNDTEASKIISNVVTNGSASLNLEISNIPFSLNASAYFDSTQQRSVHTNLYYKSSELVNAKLFMNNTAAVLSSPQLFGDESYGVIYENLESNESINNIESSENSVTSTSSMTTRMLSDLLAPNAKLKYIELYTKLNAILTKSIDNNAEIKKDSGKLEFNGDTISSNIISITTDRDGLLDICDEIYDSVTEDDKLFDLIKDIYAPYESIFGMTAKEFIKQLHQDVKDEIKSNLNSDSTVELMFYINKSGGTLAGVEFELDNADGSPVEISLMLGKSLKKSKHIELTVTADDEKITVIYETDTETKSEYSETLKIKNNYDTMYSIRLAIDNENESYSFYIRNSLGDKLFNLSGDFIRTNGTTTITASIPVNESIELFTVQNLNVTLILDENAPAKDSGVFDAPEDYTDISTASEEQLEKIATDISKNVEALVTSLAASMIFS